MSYEEEACQLRRRIHVCATSHEQMSHTRYTLKHIQTHLKRSVMHISRMPQVSLDAIIGLF
jgi:hypothetical protein